MAKKKITKESKNTTPEIRKQRLTKFSQEFTESDYQYTIDDAYNRFMLYQTEKRNSKATIDFYNRFYKKFSAFIDVKSTPITALTTMKGLQATFMVSLGDVNVQTINAYLRGYRAFGKYCEEEGYIDGFKCPIKEVQPEVKQVYTDDEIKKLLIKPNINDYEKYRNYIIIVLLMSTGARSNTILNIKLSDLDLNEGTVTFNTTKANKTVVVPLEKKAIRDLKEYVLRWRHCSKYGYLFFNAYGEQLTRGGLSKAIASYNKSRGVEKTSIHLFRHTFAKKWLTSGGDIFTLQRILTHSELDMVKRYLNLYSSDLVSAVNEHSILAQTRTRSGMTVKNKNYMRDIAV